MTTGRINQVTVRSASERRARRALEAPLGSLRRRPPPPRERNGRAASTTNFGLRGVAEPSTTASSLRDEAPQGGRERPGVLARRRDPATPSTLGGPTECNHCTGPWHTDTATYGTASPPERRLRASSWKLPTAAEEPENGRRRRSTSAGNVSRSNRGAAANAISGRCYRAYGGYGQPDPARLRHWPDTEQQTGPRESTVSTDRLPALSARHPERTASEATDRRTPPVHPSM